MQIVVAPFRLKEGVTEQALVNASNDFEEQFVRKQDGVLKRILVKDAGEGYADIVFFEDAAAVSKVIEAEMESPVCAAFFALMSDDGSHRVYDVLVTYE